MHRLRICVKLVFQVFHCAAFFIPGTIRVTPAPAAEELNPRYSVKFFRSCCHKSTSFPQLIRVELSSLSILRSMGCPCQPGNKDWLHSPTESTAVLMPPLLSLCRGCSDPFYSPRDLSCSCCVSTWQIKAHFYVSLGIIFLTGFTPRLEFCTCWLLVINANEGSFLPGWIKCNC